MSLRNTFPVCSTGHFWTLSFISFFSVACLEKNSIEGNGSKVQDSTCL